MHKPDYAVVKIVLVVGALVTCIPASIGAAHFRGYR